MVIWSFGDVVPFKIDHLWKLFVITQQAALYGNSMYYVEKGCFASIINW